VHNRCSLSVELPDLLLCEIGFLVLISRVEHCSPIGDFLASFSVGVIWWLITSRSICLILVCFSMLVGKCIEPLVDLNASLFYFREAFV
jgi:hypothetical protein